MKEKKNKKNKKQKNYKKRSKVYSISGKSLTGATTLGSFFAYQSAIDWNNFKSELENFVVVTENSLKLNLAIALPALISMVIFLIVMMKKNKEFFKDKISMNLLIVTLILYFVYSIIEVTMISLAGAFVGSLIDETVFMPLAKSAKKKADDDHEVELETRKEINRIRARQLAREEMEFDGSV